VQKDNQNQIINIARSPSSKMRREGGIRVQGMEKPCLHDKPLISIVTVVFNGAEHLEETIRSVIEQTYENIEYIIIDGCSSDGTVTIIRQYEKKITYWLSEQDCGIYDAMNKGWSLAQNNSHILFLGAGDRLVKLPKNIADICVDNLAIFGNVYLGKTRIFRSSIGLKLRVGNTLHHQALLIHKSLSLQPPFDTKYKAYADFDFNARLFKRKVKFTGSEDLIGYALPGGLTEKVHIPEVLEIIGRNFGSRWQVLALLYYFYQGLRYGFGKLSFFP
jgi:glycosyltransferase involved in cell wall biosynthesis